MSIHPRYLDKYELCQLLGRGGMAEVWKALDRQLQRYVALKLLHADLQGDPYFFNRFAREARVIASLRHPNIVQIYDFQTTTLAEYARPVAYMVMEYIDGSTLAEYIRRTSRQGRFPTNEEILQIFVAISRAVDYAHAHGMVHRDLKPANVLLDRHNMTHLACGEPILSDFGIAHLTGAASSTLNYAWVGTPLYLSPEQARGESGTWLSDIYALGVILYEMCTGTLPFQGETVPAILAQKINAPLIPPEQINPHITPALASVIKRSLAKEPAERYQSVSSLTVDLAEALRLPVPADIRGTALTELTFTERERSWPGPNSLSSPTIPASAQPAPLSSPSNPYSGTPPSVAHLSAPLSANPPPVEYTLPDESPEAVDKSPAPIAPARRNPVTPQPPEILPQSPSVSGPLHSSSGLLSSQQTGEVSSSEAAQSSPQQENAPSVESSAPQRRERAVRQLTRKPPGLLPPLRRPPHLRPILLALVMLLVLGPLIGGLFWLSQRGWGQAGNASVGQVFFVNSGTVSEHNNNGENDGIIVDLNNLQNPASGTAYYAWLLNSTNNSDILSIPLGQIHVTNGSAHIRYFNPDHTNLLAITNRFLITQEDTSNPPGAPTTDQTAWRYQATLPTTPDPQSPQRFSLLDHLRHLLAQDPKLSAHQLPGGLDIWLFRNTEKVLEWSGSARDNWETKNTDGLRNQVIRVLDYLDGSQYVQLDVPPGTPLLVNPRIAPVALLEFDPIHQDPPGYVNHINTHLQGIVNSPGVTPEQRRLAAQIDANLNNVGSWLQQVRQDARKILALPASTLFSNDGLTLLDHMETNARYAYVGKLNPTNNQIQGGVTQIYYQSQALTTMNVTAYHAGS